MSQGIKIKSADYDFFQAQNYLLEMLAEKKITQSDFILYLFYKSIGGFYEIRCSYEFISKNCGLSKGSISNGNKSLAKNKLIKVTNNGPNKTFDIEILPGSDLPRRQLKSIDKKEDFEEVASNEKIESSSADEQCVQQMNTEPIQRSAAELINIDNKYINKKYNTTEAKKALKNSSNKNRYIELINRFTDKWCSKYNTSFYHKLDFNNIENIENPSDAIKYINTLWSLDEVDKWIRNSDHSLSVFVKEYKSGRLQAYYDKTIESYKDNKRNKLINREHILSV